MLASPVLSTILLECGMPLPAATLLKPSTLLLPRNGLLFRTLRLLCLAGLLNMRLCRM